MNPVQPQVFGILNVTEDSFSDGGIYLKPDAAIAHGLALIEAGADVIDVGAESSHPDSANVDVETEWQRLQPVIERLHHESVAVSVDSSKAQIQRRSAEHGVRYLNDVTGFADQSAYGHLADCEAQLIVMHSVVSGGRAQRVDTDPDEVWTRIETFFDRRIEALTSAGIDNDRLILDPGLGFFLGSAPATSLVVLSNIDRLRHRYGVPVMISASRKSFLQCVVGRGAADAGAATLTAELWAAHKGVDAVRTHDVAALRDGLAVTQALVNAHAMDNSVTDNH